jgi:Peptidase S24-like
MSTIEELIFDATGDENRPSLTTTRRGARLLAVLAAAGHDRAWLQRTTGLGVNTVGKVIHSRPTPGTVETVARSAGVATDWLNPPDADRRLTEAEVSELRRCLRILRGIARGTRIDARDHPNVRLMPDQRVPEVFLLRGARLVYRAIGTSLLLAGVMDGDLACVRPTDRIRDVVGTLAVVQLNERLYLKRLLVGRRGRVTLQSAADGYESIVISDDDRFSLIGEVVASVREYHRS